jgi:hypothetical protein
MGVFVDLRQVLPEGALRVEEEDGKLSIHLLEGTNVRESIHHHEGVVTRNPFHVRVHLHLLPLIRDHPPILVHHLEAILEVFHQVHVHVLPAEVDPVPLLIHLVAVHKTRMIIDRQSHLRPRELFNAVSCVF